MKYIFFCPSYGFGGLEMQMVRRAQEAITRGDEALLVTAPDSKMLEYAGTLKVPAKTISIRLDYVDLFSAMRLGKIMKDEKIDSCIVGITRHLSIAIAAKKIFRLTNDIVLFQQMISGLKKIDFFHNWVYNNLDTAIVPTTLMADLLKKSTVFPPAKIDIIPYGVDIMEVDPSNYDVRTEKMRFGLPLDKRIIGQTARFENLKDQETTIRAFATAALQDTILVLAGDGDPTYRTKMQELTETLGIQQNVKFLPFTLEFGAMLSCFDIYVMSSLCETFSLALIQAMAAGKPVIGTRSGGTPEAIRHGQNGLLFEPRDKQTLAQYFKMLIQSQELRTDLGKQAKIDASSRYDRRVVNEKFFNACVKSNNGAANSMQLIPA
ncbi:MAG: glycosyltransferase family 4 protein [Candidatus Kapaibacterium sp.]